jgi:hypothetical protein
LNQDVLNRLLHGYDAKIIHLIGGFTKFITENRPMLLTEA